MRRCSISFISFKRSYLPCSIRLCRWPFVDSNSVCKVLVSSNFAFRSKKSHRTVIFEQSCLQTKVPILRTKSQYSNGRKGHKSPCQGDHESSLGMISHCHLAAGGLMWNVPKDQGTERRYDNPDLVPIILSNKTYLGYKNVYHYHPPPPTAPVFIHFSSWW